MAYGREEKVAFPAETPIKTGELILQKKEGFFLHDLQNAVMPEIGAAMSNP